VTVIFARLLREYARGESQRITHLIRLPCDGTLPVELTAHCGARFPPHVLENLVGIGGAPCNACLAAIPLPAAAPLRDLDALPSLPLAHRPTPHPRHRTPPAVPAPKAVVLGLREEELVHRVPDKPLASVLDGRTVVITVCGVLGWLTTATPEPHFRRCDDCARTEPEWPTE
jgi:hypothetical protein